LITSCHPDYDSEIEIQQLENLRVLVGIGPGTIHIVHGNGPGSVTTLWRGWIDAKIEQIEEDVALEDLMQQAIRDAEIEELSKLLE